MPNELDRLAALGWLSAPESEDGVRYFDRSDADALSYPDEGLEVLGLEGGVGYWFDHRAESVARTLARLGVGAMWEVGAGTGAMARRLTPPLKTVVTIEPIVDGARTAAKLGLPSMCGTLQDLALPPESIECIGAFDVVEHIANVNSFLNEVHRVLQPRGLFVVTVPAFGMLWGDEDDAAGHQRRYTKKRLRAEIEACGFSSLHTEYLYASLVAPAALARALPYRLGRRRSQQEVLTRVQAQLEVPPWIDRAARTILACESAIARRAILPFGLSLLGVFRRLST